MLMNLTSHETKFYILSQTVCACLRCARRGELHKLTEVANANAKMPKNTRSVGSRSFKVIEFGTNRTRIYWVDAW